MQFISASLGVECEFCHVQGKFEADDKRPKQTARKMIAMTFALNKENFDGHREVACYSCHHGKNMPVLYLVRETKGTGRLSDLRPQERRKTLCGKRHFEGALDVDYRVVTLASELP